MLRRNFHPQLRRLWADSTRFDLGLHSMTGFANLSGSLTGALTRDEHGRGWEERASKYIVENFAFCPIVDEDDHAICSLKILLLRPGAAGGLVRGGDIDNRLKTLFDALRMPQNKDELGGLQPGEDEQPFFCLLRDDKLISNVSVETDALLQPTSSDAAENDSRVIVTVELGPSRGTFRAARWI